CCELPFVPLAPTDRYAADAEARSMAVVRVFSTTAPCFAGGATALVPAGLRACFPDACRRRTLLVVLPDSPHFVRRLTPAEQTNYREVLRLMAWGLGQAGFATLEAGRDFGVDDFFDRCHQTEEGGRKLAAEVAPKLRQMAKELGYTE